MGIFSYFFQNEIDQAVNQVSARYLINNFQFLGKDQPVPLPDDYRTYIDAYLKMQAVHRCVSLINNKLASVPVILYEVREGKNQKVREFNLLNKSMDIGQKAKALVIKAQTMTEVNLKDINSLIDNPNEMDSWEDWMKKFVGSYLLTGNSYNYLNGPNVDENKPQNNRYTEMFVLPAARINIISGGMFEPVQGYKMDIGSQKELEYPAEQVIHWKTYNPEFSMTGSQLYGISPLRAYLETILRDSLGEKELNRQIKNGGSFGIISPKEKIDNWTTGQKDEFKQQLISAKKSNDEVSRIFPSSVPLGWEQIGLSVDDLKILSIKSVNEEDIYKAYNVPLQYANQDSSTYDNQSIADRQFVYNALVPLCEDIGALLTRKIADPIGKRTGKKYVIFLDFNALPEMQQDMKKITEWLKEAGWLTKNEKREIAGWGRLEVPGMDDVWISGNEIRIQDASVSSEEFSRAFEE